MTFNKHLQAYLDTLSVKGSGCEALFATALDFCRDAGIDGFDGFVNTFMHVRTGLSQKERQFFMSFFRFAERQYGVTYELPLYLRARVRSTVKKDMGKYDELSFDEIREAMEGVADPAARVAGKVNALGLPRKAWALFKGVRDNGLILLNRFIPVADADRLDLIRDIQSEDKGMAELRELQKATYAPCVADHAQSLSLRIARQLPMTPTVISNSADVAYLRKTGAKGFPTCAEVRGIDQSRVRHRCREWESGKNISPDTYQQITRVD